jgi:hypothetical protein
MQKIINGLLYDTEEAEHIAHYGNGRSTSDFDWLEETLYQTANGRFFLAGEGGARTQYATSVSTNTWSGGSDILAMSDDEAKAWLERHDLVDEYIEAFGTPELA